MKVTVNSPSKTSRELIIEVSGELIEKSIEQEANRVRKRIQLPGFRKGKAPLQMIRAQFGKQIEAAAIENVMEENYREAINTEKLNPIGPADISNMNYEPGTSLKYTAMIEVEPDITLGSLQGMRVDKGEPVVTNEMVEEELKNIQLRFGTVTTKDDPADIGDRLLLDIGEVDPVTGIALIGKKYPDQTLRLGEHIFGADFDEQLVGSKRGDKKRVVQRLEHYVLSNPHQQDNPLEIHYLIDVKKVETVNLPDIDDDLARDMEYENVEKMRKGVKDGLFISLENAEKEKLRGALEREAVRLVSPPVPRSMFERYRDLLMDKVEKLSAQFPDQKKLREEVEENARLKVKWYLVREKIIEQEGLTVSDQEIDDHILHINQINDVDARRLSMKYRSGKKREELKNKLLDNKIYNFLESKAEVRTIKQS